MKKFLLSAMAILAAATPAFAATATDGDSYEAVNGITAKNLWMYSRTVGNFADLSLGNTTSSRTATIYDGVVYIGDSSNDDASIVDSEGKAIGCASIVKYDSETGEFIGKIQVKVGEERVSGLLCANQVGIDSFGNLYMAGYSGSMASNYKVYSVDKETGAAVLEADLARTTEGRIDYCDVIGDITRKEAKCVVMAAAAPPAATLLTYRWEAPQGGEFAAGWFDGAMESYDMAATYPADQTAWSYAPVVKIVAGGEGTEYDAELFYIDGFNSLPCLYDINASVIDSFENAPDGLAPNENGTNGVAEVQLAGKNFILYSLNQYIAPDFCKMRISELGEGMVFDGMTKYWDFPANAAGLGAQTDWGTRVHSLATEKLVDANGKEAANVLTYKCANGFGVYQIAEEGFNGAGVADNAIAATEIAVKGAAIVAEGAEAIAVYNMAGQVVAAAAADAVAAPAAGVYVVAATVKGEKVVAKVVVD